MNMINIRYQYNARTLINSNRISVMKDVYTVIINNHDYALQPLFLILTGQCFLFCQTKPTTNQLKEIKLRKEQRILKKLIQKRIITTNRQMSGFCL